METNEINSDNEDLQNEIFKEVENIINENILNVLRGGENNEDIIPFT